MSQEISDNKFYILIAILSVAMVMIAAGLYTGSGTEEHTLSVSGSASINVVPDTASISLGVLIQEKTAKEASEKNSASMNSVISELRNLGLQDKEIQTSFISVQPVYEYPEKGEPAIAGYSASNNVVVTTEMLDKLGDIVDRSVTAGANQVGGVSFQVSEDKQKTFRDELITEAIKDAKSKADKLATSLDVKITGVKTTSISEGGFPVPFFALQEAERAVTPIEPGETEVTLSVQVTYLIE